MTRSDMHDRRAAGRERPILFSAPMIKALLAGTKTQTRRIIKLNKNAASAIAEVGTDAAWRWEWGSQDGHGGLCCSHNGGTVSIPLRCPYGAAGSRLWVRETWQALGFTTDFESGHTEHYALDKIPKERGRCSVAYAATDEQADWHKEDRGFSWRPGIHMPRWALRITLEITNVSVERLQDITEDDAKAEGVKPFANDPEGDCWTDGKCRTAFQYLWNEINGWKSNLWQSNPWVWVVSFKRLDAARSAE